MSIKVDDTLFQWDSGHYVALYGEDAKATEVHFALYDTCEDALNVEVKDQDGAKVAEIPNILLTEHKDIVMWTWANDQTISRLTVHVIERNKPGDYVYSPSDVLNYEHLKQWLQDKIDELQVTVATDYETLNNKPKINSVELVGNKALSELGIEAITDEDIDSMFN